MSPPAPQPPRRTAWRLALVGLLGLSLGAIGFVVAGTNSVVMWDTDNPHATKIARHHEPSRVLFPPQQIPLYFSHAKHIEQEIECATCHENVDASVRSSDVNLPGGDVCGLCHEVSEEDPAKADPPAACSTCHLQYDGIYEGFDPHEAPAKVASKPAKVHLPEPHLQFNHKVHLDRGVACSQCHQSIDKVDVAVPSNALPVMGDCMGCHDGKEAPDACTTCHVATPVAATRVQTSYATGQLKPHGFYRDDAHNEAFVKNHARVAQQDEGYCASCHAPNFCVDCHNGVAKPVQIHPANWVLVHPISAKKNSLECSSCHREQSFCVDCHRRSGVMDLAPNLNSTLQFHPVGWVNLPGSAPAAQHHMFEAQRNIRACASCHEERTCMKCHSARDPVGFGVQPARRVNPHPPGFRSRCKAMASLNERACSKCHESNDPNMLLCR